MIAVVSIGSLGRTLNCHSRRRVRYSIKVQHHQLLETIVELKDRTHV